MKDEVKKNFRPLRLAFPFVLLCGHCHGPSGSLSDLKRSMLISERYFGAKKT
jgi:hypothetical protein